MGKVGWRHLTFKGDKSVLMPNDAGQMSFY